MTAVKVEIAKHAMSRGADPAGLGRWNRIDIVNGSKNYDLYLHINVHDQKYHLVHYIFDDDDIFAININMCPHKLLIMNLEQFIKDSIELGLEVILTVDAN